MPDYRKDKSYFCVGVGKKTSRQIPDPHTIVTSTPHNTSTTSHVKKDGTGGGEGVGGGTKSSQKVSRDGELARRQKWMFCRAGSLITATGGYRRNNGIV